MPKLSVIFEGKLIKEHTFANEMALTIGRHLHNDLVIKDFTVSRAHAKIELVEGRYLLSDLNSKNGTLVNEAPVASCWLENGDVLVVGEHCLIFSSDEDEVHLKLEPDPCENPTLVQASAEEQQPEITETAVGTCIRSLANETVAALTFLEGGEGTILLTKELVKVGKDSSCDLVIGGLLIGKIAFTVSRRPTGYYLSFVGGLSVPKVSGQPVRRSMKLEEDDIIEIGPSRLQFATGVVVSK